MTKSKMYKLLESYILQNKEAHYRIVYSYVKNKENALDIVQESIYKAFDSIECLENTDSLKSWFYRILVNTSLDFLRKNKKITYVEDSELEVHSEGKTDKYRDFDLQNALEELPTDYKLVITLRYYEDLKLEDIADILGENLNTIKTRLYSGLKKLRIEMEG